MGHARFLEMGLKRKRFQKFGKGRFLVGFHLFDLLLFHAGETLDKHIGADDPQHEHIGYLDHKIRVTHRPEYLDALHACKPAGSTADASGSCHLVFPAG